MSYPIKKCRKMETQNGRCKFLEKATIKEILTCKFYKREFRIEQLKYYPCFNSQKDKELLVKEIYESEIPFWGIAKMKTAAQNEICPIARSFNNECDFYNLRIDIGKVWCSYFNTYLTNTQESENLCRCIKFKRDLLASKPTPKNK